MYKPTLAQQDCDEIYAIFRKEQPQINRAVLKMARQMKGLSDIGQKQAMCKLLADFVMWVYPDDLERLCHSPMRCASRWTSTSAPGWTASSSTSMCGRFTRFHSWADIHEMYRLLPSTEIGRNTEARYNIAPTEDVYFVTADEDGAQKVRQGRWWLVPWWAKEMPKGAMFNARIETADTSGAFKDAWKSKRCLIPADGFYEWMKNAEDGSRDPWFIHLGGTKPFSFAGLWAHNSKLDVTSCTMITMPAAEPMTRLHDCQPAILAPEAYDAWMDPATPAADVKPLLSRNLDGDLQFYRVDRRVNASSRTDKRTTTRR